MPLALLLSRFVEPAAAAWPEDVSVSGLLEHQGQPVAPSDARAALDEVIQVLGAGIANKPVFPARTLGSAGLDLSVGTTVLLIDTTSSEPGVPSSWERVHSAENPGSSLIFPTMTMRKGLPGSVEIGGSAGWIAGSRQGLLGGFARFAPVEGYSPWPDVSFQVGYTGYVGNPELDLGVVDLHGSLGGTVAFGSFPGIRQAQFSPWVGGGAVLVHARTRLLSSEADLLYDGAEGEDPALTPFRAHPQVHGGIQVTNSTVHVRIAGTWSPSSAPSLHAGMGFTF